MVKIVSINAMNSASTRRVIGKTAVVCMAVNMRRNVMKVYMCLNDFVLFSKDVLDVKNKCMNL